jgi:enediyne biosynthesis protein E4
VRTANWVIIGVLLAGAAVASWHYYRTTGDSAPSETQDGQGKSSAHQGGPGGHSESVPRGPFYFTDMTAEADIRFVHSSGDTAEKPFPAANGSGAAALDFDRDGLIDLYFLTGTPFPIAPQPGTPICRCYRNLGNWKFQDVTEFAGLGENGYSAGVAVGDFDGDGFPDIFINSYGPHRLYRNQGDGTFAEISAAAGVDADAWGTSAAFLDYDNDGLLDLYCCHYGIWSLATNRYCGDQSRGIRIFCNPTSVEAAPHLLFHNSGDGSFSDASESTGISAVQGRGQGVVAADVNRDGLIDIYVTNDMHPNLLFLNQGHGKFVESGGESGTSTDFMGKVQAGMGVDAADFNRDGLFDLFVTNYEGEHNSYFENLGDDQFQEVSRNQGLAAESLPWVGWGTKFLDLDLDGWCDVFVTNGHTDDNLRDMGRDSPYGQPPGLWKNINGRAVFAGGAGAGPYFAGTHVGRGLAVADLDNDGDWDLIIVHQNAPPALLKNECVPAAEKHWIRVELIGTISNRDAVGAELRLTSPDGSVRVEQIKGGGSYESAHDLRQILALDDDGAHSSLEIRWPSGRRSTLAPLVSGKSYQVIEPRE